jgi:adenylate cyclase
VPLRTVPSEKFGTVGTFFDIPWFGAREWETMYDHPRHRTAAQHLPITVAWAVADGRNKFVHNCDLADEKLAELAHCGYASSAKAFLANPPPKTEWTKRSETIEAVLKELEPFMAGFEGIKPEELNDDERALLNNVDVLRVCNQRNAELARTLPRKTDELRDALHGKAVLIGWTATGRTDMYPTPLQIQCPGVVVHGAIFNGLMTGDFLRKSPFWVNALITLGVGLLTTMIVGWMDPWKALSLSVLLVFGYLGLNGATLYDYGNWIVGCAGPVVAGGVVWSGLTLTRFIGEAKERGRITARFGSYADPNLVRYIVAHPELDVFEGQMRELTVVFTDLAGFTTLTEKLREKAVPILSDYMSRMVPVIQQHRGLVNKFLGDGIMFFYGAPVPNEDHAADAVRTVMDMSVVLEQFNRELEAAGNPTVSMRAGISTGPMVVGDAGSRLRSDYTVLGDAVNLGARLESANKATGTSTMLSGRTVELLGERFLVRPIGKLRVAGKTEGVMTFEPLAPSDKATEAQRELAQITREMVDAYQAGRFADCISAADRLDAKFGESKLARLYRDLSAENAANPCADFDGVITLKEK